MIQLFKPYMPQLPQLNDILHSGMLAYGQFTKQFENKLKEYFDTPYVIATNSFNTAISVAITTMGLDFGDEIIASPMACLASTQPYLGCGLNVKWCDVDSRRGTLNPECLKKTITSKTKLIVHNHFCGYPGYIDEINSIAFQYGIPVIDDGIECFGSEYKGKKIGNCGTDVTVFSLSAVRMPNTIDGGVVIFKNKEHYEKSLRVRDCGIDRTKFRDEMGEINPKYDISEMGYSATMSNVNGYIGLLQMEAVNDLISTHRKNAESWDETIRKLDGINKIKTDANLPNYWVYGCLAKDKKKIIKKFRDMGWYASGVHINNNIYSVFGDNTGLGGVDEFYNHFVALPCGWWVNAEDIDNIKIG